ncbi:hypothetical protein L6452_01737 [Arctium lappa]|uniref:Uncharacterized protein n=1 Tax=Arctium lappa TaxID=4217 RepID=A0ACB9FHG6_ARCLA|nr:hypothetical protein L6452_01737 [Arctium lappa]
MSTKGRGSISVVGHCDLHVNHIKNIVDASQAAAGITSWQVLSLDVPLRRVLWKAETPIFDGGRKKGQVLCFGAIVGLKFTRTGNRITRKATKVEAYKLELELDRVAREAELEAERVVHPAQLEAKLIDDLDTIGKSLVTGVVGDPLKNCR